MIPIPVESIESASIYIDQGKWVFPSCMFGFLTLYTLRFDEAEKKLLEALDVVERNGGDIKSTGSYSAAEVSLY